VCYDEELCTINRPVGLASVDLSLYAIHAYLRLLSRRHKALFFGAAVMCTGAIIQGASVHSKMPCIRFSRITLTSSSRHVPHFAIHHRFWSRLRKHFCTRPYRRARSRKGSCRHHLPLPSVLVPGCHHCRLDHVWHLQIAQRVGMEEPASASGSTGDDHHDQHTVLTRIQLMVERKRAWQKARDILIKYHANGAADDAFVDMEYKAMKKVIEFEATNQVGWKQLTATKGNRRRLLIMVLLGFFSQWFGNGLVS
jgi:hypothetical protein